MKILLANSTCKVGGVSTFLLSLRTALAGLGHDCELFFFSHGTMDRHLPAGVPVHFGDLTDCLRLVDRGGFDVVHANNVDWSTGISAVRHIGARLVLTAHKARDGAWAYGWTSSNCDALVTVANWIRTELQPYTDAAIQVVHNGIDIDRFSRSAAPASSPPIVAWIGRGGSDLKNIETLAGIAPGLARAGLRLWIIDQHGAAKAAEAYPAAVQALTPIAERWGGVPFDEMPALYQHIRGSGGCVLSTSTREGLPLTLLEAQASGCTVVASDVRGNNECVLPEHGGVLFPLQMPGDAVAERIRDTLAAGPSLRRGQDAARAFVQAYFSLQRMAEHYVQIYRASGPDARPQPPLPMRLKARLRLSPVVHWDRYLEQRVGVGYTQFDASRALAQQGDWRLAAGAAAASLRTSPTIFLKPDRLKQLVQAWKKSGTAGRSGTS